MGWGWRVKVELRASAAHQRPTVAGRILSHGRQDKAYARRTTDANTLQGAFP